MVHASLGNAFPLRSPAGGVSARRQEFCYTIDMEERMVKDPYGGNYHSTSDSKDRNRRSVCCLGSSHPKEEERIVWRKTHTAETIGEREQARSSAVADVVSSVAIKTLLMATTGRRTTQTAMR